MTLSGIRFSAAAHVWPAAVLGGVLLCAFAPSPRGWSNLGPAYGGRLSAIVAVPGSGGAVLLVSSPGGGVWRSTDGGATWTFPANTGMADDNIVHLEWDAAAPNRLYALSYNALYTSTNRADSWTAVINPSGHPAPLLPYQAVLNDPKPFAQMRVAGGRNVVLAGLPCSGLYYSDDGVTFTEHWPFPGGAGNPDNCLGAIAADSVSGRVYFSTLAQDPYGPSHVFRSNCAAPWRPGAPCLTWQPVNAGLPSNAIVAALVSVSTPGHGDRLIAQTPDNNTGGTQTYHSADGLSWRLQSSLPKNWTAGTLVYTGAGEELFMGNTQSYHSLDFGATWTPFMLANNHLDVRGVYADAADGKVWTTTDGSGSGKDANITRWNWRPGTAPTGGVDLGHAGLRVWQVYTAVVVPVAGTPNGRRVFLGAQDNGSLCSDTPGAWTVIGSPMGGDGIALQVAPSNPNRMYGRNNSGDGSFVRTSNAASAASCAKLTWATVVPTPNPPDRSLFLALYWSHQALAVHPTNPDRVYFALSTGIGVAAHANAPAVVIDVRSLPGDANPTVVYVDAGGAVYAGTMDHGVYRSIDDGQHWSPWGLNSGAPALITAIASAKTATASYWLATSNGVYRKTGATGAWTPVDHREGYVASDVTVDPTCASRVYVAYGFAMVFGQHQGGIDVTSDNGTTWTSLTAGLPALHRTPVTEVEVDATQPSKVYAASYGRGFWVYDWGTNLPACVR